MSLVVNGVELGDGSGGGDRKAAERTVVSRTRLHVSDKAFSIAGPHASNALPSDIKLILTRTSFRTKLKTHFFSLI